MLIYINVPAATLFAVQVVYAISKRDQFLMKLRPNFEIARSNMMNRHPIPSYRIVTKAIMEHRANVSAPVSVAYAA